MSTHDPARRDLLRPAHGAENPGEADAGRCPDRISVSADGTPLATESITARVMALPLNAQGKYYGNLPYHR
jgi:hypothetical protein